MIDEAGFRDLKNYIKRRVGYARYLVGLTYYKVPLNRVEINSDGTVRVWISILPGSSVTVTMQSFGCIRIVLSPLKPARQVSCTGLILKLQKRRIKVCTREPIGLIMS